MINAPFSNARSPMLAHFSAAIHGLGKLHNFYLIDCIALTLIQFHCARIMHNSPSKMNLMNESITTFARLESRGL